MNVQNISEVSPGIMWAGLSVVSYEEPNAFRTGSETKDGNIRVPGSDAMLSRCKEYAVILFAESNVKWQVSQRVQQSGGLPRSNAEVLFTCYTEWRSPEYCINLCMEKCGLQLRISFCSKVAG